MLQFNSLARTPGLHHAITTRSGGCSSGAYASLNLGYHVGDEAHLVTGNRLVLARQMGFEASSVVAAQQVHGARVHVATAGDRGRGALDWDGAISATDALVTGESGLPLLILVADCAPILLVDPIRHVLAVVHAGWRGALAGVAGAAVQCMTADLGSNPADIRAGIGPCLCLNCLEVGEEVAAEVALVDAAAVIRGTTKPHLDLRALIRSDLERNGIGTLNISAMPRCPRCEPELFFSHRGQSGVAGRLGLVAWWD